jgi:hypothetical protein
MICYSKYSKQKFIGVLRQKSFLKSDAKCIENNKSPDAFNNRPSGKSIRK